MFLFYSDTALLRSMLRISDDEPTLYLFSGAVPDTLNDVPFNIHNLAEVSKNAEAMLYYRANVIDSDAEKSSLFEGDHGFCHMPIKRSVMDQQRGIYRLAPRYQGLYEFSPEYLNEFPEYTDGWHDAANLEENDTQLNGLLRQSYGDWFWKNERDENNTSNTDLSRSSTLSRFGLADNHGQYMEFEQPVEVTHIEIWQALDTRYTSDEWYIETINETTGEWEIVHTLNGLNNDDVNFIELPSPVTADKFIISHANTGTNHLQLRHISLMSTTEPYNVETVELTWALMYPRRLRIDSFLRSNTDSFNEAGNNAVMLLNVGEVRDADVAVVLNRTRNLPGYFNPKLLNLTFNIGADTGE
jgi:hypothetical protein